MQAHRIVVLTGAGISAESGLQTFRAADGLWEDHRIEDVAMPEGFARNPSLVHEFYNARRKRLAEAEPNPAHFALAEFEDRHRKSGGEFLLVTQNIDDLHERAGSAGVLHMHGELLKKKCGACGGGAMANDDMSEADACEICGAAGAMRPDIVWFGEMPYGMEKICAALAKCDLFVSIGTSGSVYPAAGFVQQAAAAGAERAELNLEPSAGGSWFSHAIYGPASRVVGEFFQALNPPGSGANDS